nr:hypothetical protein [Planococcus sp. ISL-110]
MGEGVEMHGEFLRLEKKRTIKLQKSPEMCVSWSLDLNVSCRLASGHWEAVNEAEIFLLPEELPVFTRALIEHPILLPTSYSQHLSMERGMYCIRLTSYELPEDFAERLFEALSVLE